MRSRLQDAFFRGGSPFWALITWGLKSPPPNDAKPGGGGSGEGWERTKCARDGPRALHRWEKAKSARGALASQTEVWPLHKWGKEQRAARGDARSPV
jgi:hypothetical protein